MEIAYDKLTDDDLRRANGVKALSGRTKGNLVHSLYIDAPDSSRQGPEISILFQDGKEYDELAFNRFQKATGRRPTIAGPEPEALSP